MADVKPTLLIIAGPNGSGKTTVAEFLLKVKSIVRFINADSIAKGLSLGESSAGNIEAGRIMLSSLKTALEEGQSVAFETTLSGRMWIHLIEFAKSRGFDVAICYVAVKESGISVSRVEKRTLEGGHAIPNDDIHRRFKRSLKLFFNLYANLVSSWYFFDNSGSSAVLIASRENGSPEKIYNKEAYERFRSQA